MKKDSTIFVGPQCGQHGEIAKDNKNSYMDTKNIGAIAGPAT